MAKISPEFKSCSCHLELWSCWAFASLCINWERLPQGCSVGDPCKTGGLGLANCRGCCYYRRSVQEQLPTLPGSAQLHSVLAHRPHSHRRPYLSSRGGESPLSQHQGSQAGGLGAGTSFCFAGGKLEALRAKQWHPQKPHPGLCLHPLPCWSQTVLDDMLMDVFNFNSFVFIWSTILQPLPQENARPRRARLPGGFLLTGLQSPECAQQEVLLLSGSLAACESRVEQ